jgi:hypothetical protein
MTSSQSGSPQPLLVPGQSRTSVYIIVIAAAFCCNLLRPRCVMQSASQGAMYVMHTGVCVGNARASFIKNRGNKSEPLTDRSVHRLVFLGGFHDNSMLSADRYVQDVSTLISFQVKAKEQSISKAQCSRYYLGKHPEQKLRASPAVRRILTSAYVRLRRPFWSKSTARPFASGVAPAARRIF